MTSGIVESVFLTGPSRPETMSDRVLVLGGDATGVAVAERLALEGYEVLLTGAPDLTPCHANISPITGLSLDEVRGFVRGFDAVFRSRDGRVVQRVGFIVAAQPAQIVSKHELYGIPRSRRTPSLSELENILAAGAGPGQGKGEWFHVAFLCGLEGDSDAATFSRVLGALETLQESEQVQPYVFARQLKVAAAGLERRYRECREKGALFFKFDGEGPTFESGPDGPVMVFNDPLLGTEMELLPDLLIVDEQSMPPSSLGPLFDAIPSSPACAPFLQPESPRFCGVNTPKAGIFAVGPSRGAFLPELIASDIEAVVVALREARLSFIDPTLPGAPEIDPLKCTICLTCVRMCPHGALTFRKKAEADPGTCVRCGICAVECPNEAITLPPASGDPGIGARIADGLACSTAAKTIVAFLCARSASQAKEKLDGEVFRNIVPVVVPCAGTVDIAHILEAFREKADAVLVAGCFKGNCASVYGTVMARERMLLAAGMLQEAAIDPARLAFVQLAGNRPADLITAIRGLETAIGLL